MYQTIDAIYDYLYAKGVQFPEYYKRRDPQEPGRIEKEQNEDKLARVVRRYFRVQKGRIKAWLEQEQPDRKAAQIIPFDILKDEEIEALILKLLLGFIMSGTTLMLGDLPDIVDLDSTLAKTIEWVQAYGYNLIRGINETTMKGVRKALDLFVSTPGMTIGDVIAAMPFGPARAQMIAVTEITRAYAEGQLRVAEQLMEDYPDLRVVKTWYTNNDGLVCPICNQMNEVTILADRSFPPLGFNAPPAHPNCRCWIITRVDILGSDIE